MSFEVNFIKWLGMWIPSLKLHFIFWLNHSHKIAFQKYCSQSIRNKLNPKVTCVFLLSIHCFTNCTHVYGRPRIIKIFCCLVPASQQGFLMMKSWCGYTKGNGTIIVGVTAEPRLCLLTWMVFPSEFCQRTPICRSRNIAMTELTFFPFWIFIQMMVNPLREIDKTVGQLMDGLKQLKLHRCVNVIFVGDHGKF